MITYLLMIFPHNVNVVDEKNPSKTYEDAKDIMDSWGVKGDHVGVLSKYMPVYIKDVLEYQIFCIDSDRIDATDFTASVESKKSALKLNGLDVVSVLTDNIQKWLKDNGYVLKVTEAYDVQFL